MSTQNFTELNAFISKQKELIEKLELSQSLYDDVVKRSVSQKVDISKDPTDNLFDVELTDATRLL
jgi:hypothetical protein